MADHGGSVDGEPPVIEPYDVLRLERTATHDQIKSAYRKAALRNHPDKVSEAQRAEAHTKFQSIAFAYAVLSDPVRRKRYDATGSTSDSIVGSDGFDWSEYYADLFRDAVSADAIETFSRQYKGSDEERDDLLVAYERAKGDMDAVYESVMVSSVLEDDERFRKIIDDAIANENVPAFGAYIKETKKKREARLRTAKKESREAEEYAKELGVHDKLFAASGTNGKPSKSNKAKAKDDQAGLAALIQRNQKSRAGFLDGLAAKYGAIRTKKGKKRGTPDDDDDDDDDEPPEEAFRATAAKLQAAKDAKPSSNSSRKRSKRQG